ncbi:MAG: hypothetical protein QNI88_17110 [Desulfobacterales bacterium]|nr:hypothetical protein [Desulfobacterales bacterium]
MQPRTTFTNLPAEKQEAILRVVLEAFSATRIYRIIADSGQPV